MKVCPGHPQTWLPLPLLIQRSVYAPNDSPSSTRKEENDGVVRLPNRCCQERTAAAGRSYHLVLCHLHPSGLCFRSDLVKTVLLERTYLCPYIKLQFFPADWISALSPSPSQHGRKRGFWDPGAGFYGLWYIIIFFFMFADMLSYSALLHVAPTSFCQRTDCTTAAREPKS